MVRSLELYPKGIWHATTCLSPSLPTVFSILERSCAELLFYLIYFIFFFAARYAIAYIKRFLNAIANSVIPGAHAQRFSRQRKKDLRRRRRSKRFKPPFGLTTIFGIGRCKVSVCGWVKNRVKQYNFVDTFFINLFVLGVVCLIVPIVPTVNGHPNAYKVEFLCVRTWSAWWILKSNFERI